MAKSLEELEKEIRSLNEDDRLHLLRCLIADLDGEQDPNVERAWLEEVRRRQKELEKGLVEPVPAETVFERARARLEG